MTQFCYCERIIQALIEELPACKPEDTNNEIFELFYTSLFQLCCVWYCNLATAIKGKLDEIVKSGRKTGGTVPALSDVID